MRLQIIEQFSESLAAMGDYEFFFRAQLSERPVQRGIEKVGIVAEAACASWFILNQSFGPAFDHRQDLSALGESDHAGIMRRTFGGRNICQFAEQFPVVRSVIGLGSCVPRGKNTGSGSQRVNADPRVVGEDQRIRPLTVIARLLAGIYLKGVSIFNADGKILDAGEKFNFNLTTFGRLPELPEFTGVRGGKIDG